MERFQLVAATFIPKIKDVVDMAKPYIGRRCYFERAWIITDEDSKPYVGQYAWRPIDINTEQSLFGWCPCEDLKNVFKY